MDQDRKSTPLKALQGKIWEEGYARGELVGEVFADVPAALERWRAQDLQISIFSSGSVLAQQLLFRHSSAGDLSRFIRAYFDTTTGAKGDSESYRRIAAAMALPAPAILFVSDVTERARCRAARGHGVGPVGEAGEQAAAVSARARGDREFRPSEVGVPGHWRRGTVKDGHLPRENRRLGEQETRPILTLRPLRG